MLTTKNDSLRILKKKASDIYSLYQKATLFLSVQNNDSEFPTMQIQLIGKIVKLDPQQFVSYVDSALNAMPVDSSVIIKKELFNQKEYRNMDYLELLSRATYFRHQKIAFQQFVAFFE